MVSIDWAPIGTWREGAATTSLQCSACCNLLCCHCHCQCHARLRYDPACCRAVRLVRPIKPACPLGRNSAGRGCGRGCGCDAAVIRSDTGLDSWPGTLPTHPVPSTPPPSDLSPTRHRHPSTASTSRPRRFRVVFGFLQGGDTTQRGAALNLSLPSHPTFRRREIPLPNPTRIALRCPAPAPPPLIRLRPSFTARRPS